MPTKLARQLELLESWRSIQCIRSVSRSGKRIGQAFRRALHAQLCQYANCDLAARMYRGLRSGYFDERIKWVEDWWFWVKISYMHTFVYTDEALARYRVHQKSTGRVQREGYKANRMKVFHRTLRNYPGIPSRQKAQIYYHIGVALEGLTKKKYARRCFIRSLQLQRSNMRALCRLLLSFFESLIASLVPKFQ
jgi:hypothetical protein